jgi:hypothetical protein
MPELPICRNCEQPLAHVTAYLRAWQALHFDCADELAEGEEWDFSAGDVGDDGMIEVINCGICAEPLEGEALAWFLERAQIDRERLIERAKDALQST